MASQTSEPRSNFFYLKHATVGQILGACKSAFWLWLGMSIFGLIIQFVIHQGTSAAVGLDAVPSKFWLLAVIPLLSWVLRGKTFAIPTFTIPKLTFLGWLLFSLLFLSLVVGGIIIDLLPWWASPPFYGALLPVLLSYIGLVEMGKSNYAKSEGP